MHDHCQNPGQTNMSSQGVEHIINVLAGHDHNAKENKENNADSDSA